MQSLAIKYRPSTFEDVVEQENIKIILQEQLKTKTFKNCYLFTGGAGTGKTTCARIFANELNERKGNPIEIDAASNNGVENVREIIDNAKFKSIDAQYKIYIIDECHMLSTGAWNAMLKLLEEPPVATMFIMCTTDPQKIPATILSRVQRYDFQRISFASIVDRLAFILREETTAENKIDFNFEAIEYIAKLADGGMRDAITLLDKCISYSTEITIENVTKALGTIDYDTMLNLSDYLLNKDAENAIITVEEIYRQGADLKQFVKQYTYFILDCLKYNLLASFEYLQIPSTLKTKLDAYSNEDFDFFNFLLKAMIELSNNIKWDNQPKSMIEATIFVICKE